MQKITLIERRDVKRNYGFAGTEAVIDHPTHGRMLLCDGFGGIDSISGGTVRWAHGMAIKLHDGDTFETLDGAQWTNDVTLMQATQHGYDDTRPVLDWDGLAIARAAAAAGL